MTHCPSCGSTSPNRKYIVPDTKRTCTNEWHKPQPQESTMAGRILQSMEMNGE